MQLKRILVVGYGSIGKRHLRIIRNSIKNAQIMLLRHTEVAEAPGLADFATSSIDDVKKFSPQAAVIASPATFRLDIARVLADLNCHLLIEKPICANSMGVSEFLSTARNKGVVCQVGYNLRFLPSLVKFRRLIKESAIGEVFSVHCEVGSYLPLWRPTSDYRKTVSANNFLGGGVLLELSHEIDYLKWIFGEVLWVNAWSGKVSNLDVDVEDSTRVIIAFKTDNNRELVGNISLDFIRRDKTRCCKVIGEKGTLLWDGIKDSLEFCGENNTELKQIFCMPTERDYTYEIQWENFVQCIELKSKPYVTGEDGLETLRIVELIKLSAHSSGSRKYYKQ